MPRLFDIGCSAIGLLLLSPLFFAIAVLILIGDGPPILFTQLRVGKNGKRFDIWKFRTMRPGFAGIPVTASHDKRITRIGRELRRYKLDELPQLFNVLRGDMSLVGPRPEVADYVNLESADWQAVLRVRPGITDMATLLYRNEEELLSAAGDIESFYCGHLLPAKLFLHRRYLQERSFWTDLKLIFLTIHYSFFTRDFDPDLVKRKLGMGTGNG